MGDAPGFLNRIGARLRPHLRPRFVIIGTQKAGTSALFSMLAEHPQVLVPAVKELHFFDRDENYGKGSEHYWRQFPLVPLRGGDRITFEATPAYIFHPQAPRRMHEAMPEVRLIAMLRDPVSRAYSAWNMRRQFKDDPLHARSFDPRSFHEAIADELGGNGDPLITDYLARGNYAEQIKRILSFFPADQLLVLNYRAFKSDPATVLQQVCRFTDLHPFKGDEPFLTRRYNERPYGERMDEDLKERLKEHFRPSLAELDGLLGIRLDLFGEAAP